MNTDDLIGALARDSEFPVRRSWPWSLPLLAMLILSLAALAMANGQPLAALPDIGPAPYVMKLTFAGSVALIGAMALRVCGTPGRGLRTVLLVLAAPFLVVLLLAGAEVLSTGPAWPGQTWFACIATVALLTPLGFIACVTTLRRMAPTQLRLGGALSGLVASATAASAYAMWCPETSAVFLAAWYAGPILAATGAGALLGPRLLRW